MHIALIPNGLMQKKIQSLFTVTFLFIIDVDNTLCMNDIRHSFSET